MEDSQPEETVEFHGNEYHFLGTGFDQELLHYYRFTPSHAELLLLSYDDGGRLRKDDRWILDNGDPKSQVEAYAYQNGLEDAREVVDHDYRNLPDPEFEPDLNESLGGSLLLDDGDYVLPFRIQFGKAAKILESEAERQGDSFWDNRPQYLELVPGNALQKYRLRKGLRGPDHIRGTRIVDEVQVVDRGSEQVFESFDVDQLAGEHFVEELASVDGLDDELAEELVDEYTNLRGVSWACSSDMEHVEEEFDLDPERLWKELGEAGVYRNDQSANAGRLKPPERLEDEFEDEEDSIEEEEQGEQSGLNEFQ